MGIILESALIWSGEAQKAAATYFGEENEKEEKIKMNLAIVVIVPKLNKYWVPFKKFLETVLLFLFFDLRPILFFMILLFDILLLYLPYAFYTALYL